MWEYRAKIKRVVDGDTIDFDEIDLGFGFKMFWSEDKKLRFRLLDVDTPERGEEGWAAATAVVQQWVDEWGSIGGKWPFMIRSHEPLKTDNFGRWLAEVYTIDGLSCINDILAEHGWGLDT